MGKIVYHYCKVETFFNIIKNKELWLTDITKSNDSKELQLAYDTLKKMLEGRLDECKNELKKIHTLIKGIDEAGNSEKANEIQRKIYALESCIEILEKSGFFDKLFHICCFSEDADSLSQWAIYGDNGTGIAIGFNSGMLKNYKNIGIMDFEKVHYSLDQFIDMANKKIDKILSVYNTDHVTNASCHSEFFEFIVEEVIKKAYYYKNKPFEQEREYRLVYNSTPCEKRKNEDEPEIYEQTINNKEIKLTDLGDTLGQIDYYVSKGKIVSYRPLRPSSFPFFINEIVIGPKAMVDEKDIENFLRSNEMFTVHTKIRKSEITYQ